jgi:hypothetical protein
VIKAVTVLNPLEDWQQPEVTLMELSKNKLGVGFPDMLLGTRT